MKKGLVNVLMTCYNAEKLIQESVRSLMSQTYEHIELIIVEDGSTDNTKQLLIDLAKKDQRIKLFFPGRLGRAKALNYGLRQCTGEYIAINDADDISVKDRIKWQVDFLTEHPNVGLLGGNKHVRFNNSITTSNVEINDKQIRKAFAYGQPIQHSTVMFRKTILDKVNGYNEQIPFLLDRDIFIRVGKISEMHQLEEPLITLTRNDDQFFRNTYTGFERRKMSTRYQLKAIHAFGLNYFLYVEVLAKFLYGTFILPIIQSSNKNE